MHSRVLLAFTRVCLWFVVLVSSSVAAPNAHRNSLQNWIRGCNCSCLTKKPRKLVLSNCVTKEAFTFGGDQGQLLNSSIIPRLNETPEWQLSSCKRNLHDKKEYKYMLLNLSCGEDRALNVYVIYRQRIHTTLKTTSSFTTALGTESLLSTSSTKQEERKEDNSDPSKGLIIGLTIGLGLMAAIIVGWVGICWRRRRTKKKSDEKEQNPAHGYIDEEEDSVPYRIVDLQTHISCDASGYTFLEASKKDEENPYQKLQPKCSRVNNDHKDCSQTNHDDQPFEEVVEDEPVYFLLEGEETSKSSLR